MLKMFPASLFCILMLLLPIQNVPFDNSSVPNCEDYVKANNPVYFVEHATSNWRINVTNVAHRLGLFKDCSRYWKCEINQCNQIAHILMECPPCPGGRNNTDCRGQESMTFDPNRQHHGVSQCALPSSVYCPVKCNLSLPEYQCCSWNDCPNFCHNFQCDSAKLSTSTTTTTTTTTITTGKEIKLK